MHWEVQVLGPLFAIGVLTFSYSVFVTQVLSVLPTLTLQLTAFLHVSVVASFFLWAYCAAVWMDPGFLPYSWVATQKLRYAWDEQLSGLAVRRDQMEFALRHKPPFASFSQSSGRFVIRADHHCPWIANWVGKRNHKQFALMNFWGCITALSICGWHRRVALPQGKESPMNFPFEFALVLGFGVVFLVFIVKILAEIAMNQTAIDRWNHRERDSRNCRESAQEIFGYGPIWTWFIPTAAFGDDPFDGREYDLAVL
jgi:hypothetical protein